MRFFPCRASKMLSQRTVWGKLQLNDIHFERIHTREHWGMIQTTSFAGLRCTEFFGKAQVPGNFPRLYQQFLTERECLETLPLSVQKH